MEVLTPVKVLRSPRRHVGGVAAGVPDHGYRAYQALYLGFIAAPILAGLDKFFNLLTNWDQYLAPWVANLTGGGYGLMKAIGVVEIAAGLLVAVSPRLGGLVVMAWLWGIIVNLVTFPGFYDIALRDFGLSLGAFALSRLALEYGHPPSPITLRE